jgi:hypothetical protein
MRFMSRDDIIRRFAESLGQEKATELVDQALQGLGLAQKSLFNKPELLQVAEHLKRKGGLIGITAHFWASELHLMD